MSVILALPYLLSCSGDRDGHQQHPGSQFEIEDMAGLKITVGLHLNKLKPVPVHAAQPQLGSDTHLCEFLVLLSTIRC